jgi:hypothetical protein
MRVSACRYFHSQESAFGRSAIAPLRAVSSGADVSLALDMTE